MTRTYALMLTTAFAVLAPEIAQAQPIRQLPGTRPYLPGSPPINQVPLNPRTRATPDGIGVESTDFYGKKGYPKQLGDSRETQTTGGGAAATGTLSGGSQAAGSAGFQGNTGNQIGQNGGGTVLGGLFGGGGGGGAVGFRNGSSDGVTGGAFSGMVPKGFGFGGSPDFTHSWTSPLHGATDK